MADYRGVAVRLIDGNDRQMNNEASNVEHLSEEKIALYGDTQKHDSLTQSEECSQVEAAKEDGSGHAACERPVDSRKRVGRKRGQKRRGNRRHADDLLKHANYNDEPDPAVKATVEKLVDTSKVIELEHIDFDALPKKPIYHFMKRAFDIVSCSIALVICAIPMGVIAIMVKRDSPGPVFYRQERLGYMGKPIIVTKFRSMQTDAEKMGAQWAQGEDPRVTKVGAFLRKTRLDEIPQFWAVVKGDMSLIGPRPEREVFYNEFDKYIHGFSQRMLVKPGISGLAQVNGGYNLIPAEKVVYDLYYIKNQTALLDCSIICETFNVLFSHKGAR